MARPVPAFEDQPLPISVSFPRKVRGAGQKLIKVKPELDLKDFSHLVNRSLSEYIERHHPGLIESVAAELRVVQYQQVERPALKVAEPGADVVTKHGGRLLRRAELAALKKQQKPTRVRHK